MDGIDIADWAPRASALADHMVAAGVLTDLAWRAAFAATPRHRYVPAIVDNGQLITTDDPRWLDMVYADEALTTQVRQVPAGTTEVSVPSSSSSKPSVMASMLELLQAREGHRVLEIGTGTGYNAALLSHRLGSDMVGSIELDPDLADSARERLASTGRHPRIVVGNGAAGWPEGGPFDRIIATCAVSSIPPAWIDQLAPEGRIVAPLDAATAGPLLVLDKTADDEVVGVIDPFPALFMPLRDDVSNPLAPGRVLSTGVFGVPHYGMTALDPATALDPDFALFLWLHAPGIQMGRMDKQDLVVAHRGRVRAEASLSPNGDGKHRVRQYGHYRLWDIVEHAASAFDNLGRPGANRMGVTAANVTGCQYVWLDDAEGDHSWPLTGSAD
ncbi:methyltransferase domain-containing protein [Amycolatopsis sp. PS_44_ISF1]|uniref:methyltransferase domain-containing protein n=1 Tax=Amycolatopsis sp. PS_44_ISF1 TaxID=2974917 RepID=UPI0028DFA860|nr:methyltransferase domain-containing protein [Amycolatopsis sp. PS_44_ISF1]MDT8915780.1 methyltransferase domain-containing protein [Amycolatopsis sp. PS_44_ISF1]MDT8916184.1 methyltransferase domain-containing protein [Amycolatopsis sp. PS_44_ISF1]